MYIYGFPFFLYIFILYWNRLERHRVANPDVLLALFWRHSQVTELQIEWGRFKSAHKDTNYSVGGYTTKYLVVISNFSGSTGDTITKYKLVGLAANEMNVERRLKLLCEELKGLSQNGLHSVLLAFSKRR